MRVVTKEKDPPQILIDNADEWLAEWLADKENRTKRYRYRHPDIKKALVAETSSKCVYCESIIGVVHPGETEHKIPSSKVPNLHFEWQNLTRACTECNRRKNNFYAANDGFLDPYADPVEDMLEHEGPIVFWRDGDARAETAVRTLELNARRDLILAKTQTLMDLKNLLCRHYDEQDPPLKELLRLEIVQRAEATSEYSGMIRDVLRKKGLLAR